MSHDRPLRVKPCRGLSGSVTLPGDKSLSHRALLVASVADGISRIENCLFAGVTQAMIECLEALGAVIETERGAGGETSGSADILVHGRGLRGLNRPDRPLLCRGSATTMRLMAGVLAGEPFQSVLDGNDRLRMRPMNRVVEPLREKGALVGSKDGYAPLTFSPATLRSSEHVLSVASAQVKSAILLAGLFSEGPTTVAEPHRSRDHTERMLRELGVEIEEWEDDRKRHWVRMSDGVTSVPPLNTRLPSDPSSAAFLAVAGLLVPGSDVKVPDVCMNPGRVGIFDALQEMGAGIEVRDPKFNAGEPCATLRIQPGELTSTTVRGARVPAMIDEFPIFAVAATQAQGKTLVQEAAELRLKESDRIQALAEELQKMGALIEPHEDGFAVEGPVRLRGAAVNARGDHRLAMSLAVAGLIADGETVIQGWEVLHDSFPDFPQILKRLGADVAW